MIIYMPAALNKWDSIKGTDTGISFKMAGKSIGYLCCFASYADCKAEFPNRDVIEMTAEGGDE